MSIMHSKYRNQSIPELCSISEILNQLPKSVNDCHNYFMITFFCISFDMALSSSRSSSVNFCRLLFSILSFASFVIMYFHSDI